MDSSIFPFFVLVIVAGLGSGSAATEVSLTDQSVIEFADQQTATARLGEVDPFVRSLSPFDRSARVRTNQPVSQGEFLKFVSAQAVEWDEEEIRRLTKVVRSVGNKLAFYASHFPERVLLVKTSGKEEGGAAYCRGANVIVFPRTKLDDSSQALEDLLVHELFHILTRNNRDLRDSLYSIVGFARCTDLELPEALKPREITNPDAPVIEHYIEVNADGDSVAAVPVLYASHRSYEAGSGRSLFDYLTFRLLVVEKVGDRWQPAYDQGHPRLLEISEVRGFHEQIGRNTGYIIHPEEVLAENFVLLVNGKREVPDPQILEQMRRLLTSP